MDKLYQTFSSISQLLDFNLEKSFIGGFFYFPFPLISKDQIESHYLFRGGESMWRPYSKQRYSDNTL